MLSQIVVTLNATGHESLLNHSESLNLTSEAAMAELAARQSQVARTFGAWPDFDIQMFAATGFTQFQAIWRTAGTPTPSTMVEVSTAATQTSITFPPAVVYCVASQTDMPADLPVVRQAEAPQDITVELSAPPHVKFFSAPASPATPPVKLDLTSPILISSGLSSISDVSGGLAAAATDLSQASSGLDNLAAADFPELSSPGSPLVADVPSSDSSPIQPTNRK